MLHNGHVTGSVQTPTFRPLSRIAETRNQIEPIILIEDGSRYQTDAELGTRLSGGCQRQADLDADFVWDFAQIGTTVVVL